MTLFKENFYRIKSISSTTCWDLLYTTLYHSLSTPRYCYIILMTKSLASCQLRKKSYLYSKTGQMFLYKRQRTSQKKLNWILMFKDPILFWTKAYFVRQVLTKMCIINISDCQCSKLFSPSIKSLQLGSN